MEFREGAFDFQTSQQNRLKDCGLSTRVEYGENGQEASIKLFREVGEGFIISDPQLVHVPTIELCLNSSGEWRVFGFAI